MIQNLNRLLKALWIKACRYDKIAIDSKFVIFSNDNPYIERYNKMMKFKQKGK